MPHFAQVLVEKFFSVEQRKRTLIHDKDYLEFEFTYKPLKPGKFTFDFVVKKAEGPKWRYRIALEATEPDPDDIVEFESALLVTSSVSFRLTNWQKSEAEFHAKFTSDSGTRRLMQPTSSRWSRRKGPSSRSDTRAPTSWSPSRPSSTARRSGASSASRLPTCSGNSNLTVGPTC